MNIFSVLSMGKSRLHETSMSAMLAYLLNPNQDHGLGNKFLKSFLELANENNIYSMYIEKIGLNKLKFDIVFITTSENMNIKELKKISSYIKISIIKKNIGYDFISWKTGLYAVDKYNYYKQIIHLNDSIFSFHF